MPRSVNPHQSSQIEAREPIEPASSHESKGGEASLDMTQWASVRAFDRARLWRETLASLPYVRDYFRGELFSRENMNASLAAASDLK